MNVLDREKIISDNFNSVEITKFNKTEIFWKRISKIYINSQTSSFKLLIKTRNYFSNHFLKAFGELLVNFYSKSFPNFPFLQNANKLLIIILAALRLLKFQELVADNETAPSILSPFTNVTRQTEDGVECTASVPTLRRLDLWRAGNVGCMKNSLSPSPLCHK